MLLITQNYNVGSLKLSICNNTAPNKILCIDILGKLAG